MKKSDAESLEIALGVESVIDDSIISFTEVLKGRVRTIDITDRFERLPLSEAMMIEAPENDFLALEKQEDNKRVVEEILGSGNLDEISIKCLRLYYGLEGRGDMTFGKIGDKLKITRERARRIVNRAIKKLKHPSRLAGFSKHFL